MQYININVNYDFLCFIDEFSPLSAYIMYNTWATCMYNFMVPIYTSKSRGVII